MLFQVQRIVVYFFLGWSFLFPLFAKDEDGVGFKVEIKNTKSTGRKKFAVLVGVKESQHQQFDSLANPESDVAEIERNLTQKGGFSVTTFTGNPKLAEVNKWLDGFLKDIPEGSVFLFYFSGHGEISKNGSTWMYMYDSKLKENKEATVLQESKLLDKLVARNKNLPPGKKIDIILFINACRTIQEGNKDEISENFGEFIKQHNVTRFYSSQIDKKANDKGGRPDLSLFTSRFVQAINNSAIPQKKEKPEKTQEESEQNSSSSNKKEQEENSGDNSLGADSAVNGGNGDRKVTLIEIQKFMTKVLKKEQEPVIIIADGMQDFPLVDLDKSFDPCKYVLRSALVPGWGEYSYGKDYSERTSGWWSQYVFGPAYGIIFLGLAGRTVADFRVYNNRQKAFRAEPLLPAQPLGYDTILYNFWNLNEKKSKLEQATDRYNESASLLLGFWLFNIAQAGLVPLINNKYPDFLSLQFDLRPTNFGQHLYANSGHWERYASFSLKLEF